MEGCKSGFCEKGGYFNQSVGSDKGSIAEGKVVDGGNSCEGNVVKYETLTEAGNKPICPGMFKVPVVLSEFVIQIDVESKIRLNCPSYEIKRIEKQVFLTQARYIAGTDKVFIGGYIRKNIEYASKHCTSRHGISGVINDQTVQVPFQVATRIKFNGKKPIIFPNRQPNEVRYFDQCRLGKDIREADRASYEVFNEPVYAELLWSEVYDADIDDKGKPIDCLPNEEEFQEFIDKSVVYIGIKLLQKQQIYKPCYGKEDKGFEGSEDNEHFYSNPGFNGIMSQTIGEDK